MSNLNTWIKTIYSSGISHLQNKNIIFNKLIVKMLGSNGINQNNIRCNKLLTSIFLIMVIPTFISCSNSKSGEIDYILITNNHINIKNQLKNAPENKRDSLYMYYTSLYPKYDTTRVKIYFDLDKNISKEIVISSTNNDINNYYKDANIEKYRKNNTELVWMETYKKERYKIKEILSSKNNQIPYFNGKIEGVTVTNSILGLKTKSGKINFNEGYPQQNSGEFDIWYANEIPLSVGPEEFFVKDLFLLKAISKDKSFLIKVDTINFMKINKDIFKIPVVFDKEVNMKEFHNAMGM